MRAFDYFLRDWRYRIAAPYVQQGSSVLDIGGYDGSFLRLVGDRIARGVCIDPLAEERSSGRISFVRMRLADVLPFPDSSFDVVTMLAVFEHLGARRDAIVAEAARVLMQGGLAVLTIPAPAVDSILRVLEAVRIVDADTLDEHQHAVTAETIELFARCGLVLKRRAKFQLGLNNLFIFEKRGADREPATGRDAINTSKLAAPPDRAAARSSLLRSPQPDVEGER
jgi:ubiquinone/menaquinone biosynthesis C-methylase UbiE